MPGPPPLTPAEVDAFLRDHPGWALVDGKLFRSFRFDDFVAAFGFMARAALVAEKLDHHPDWSNVYNTVDVQLSTHSAGALTANDTELAAAMDRLAG